jgi:hypothetical protein
MKQLRHRGPHLLLAASALLALAACSAPAYRPSWWPGAPGYSERRIDARTFSVNFSAHHDDLALARRATLFRCAELARAEGYARFVLREQSAMVQVQESGRKASVSVVAVMFHAPGTESAQPAAGTPVYVVSEVLASHSPAGLR